MKMKRWGDRKDGCLIRDLDAMHFVMGVLYPNRCDNEGYIAERIDITNLLQYVAEKNQAETEFRYTFFHLLVTAMVKTIMLRPRLNRFIVNGNYYQRNEVSASFVVKKQFSDQGGESMVFLRAKKEDTLSSIHEYLRKKVMTARSDEQGSTEDAMDILNKIPRRLSKTAIRLLMWLDKHGWVPQSIIESDPFYASVVLSNLGSIKLKSGYHHLTNWGTCSLFCIVGEKKKTPVFAPDGSCKMRETLDLGLTIDERVADGYYYAKSIRLLKYLLEHPQELEKPLSEEVSYE